MKPRLKNQKESEFVEDNEIFTRVGLDYPEEKKNSTYLLKMLNRNDRHRLHE